MKKTLILLLILIVVASLYYVFSKSDEKSSINIESRNFIVKNIDDISYITIKNPAYPMMHLEKKSDDYWLLNGKYKADNHIVDNMKGVLNKMEIRNIPTDATNKNVIANLGKVGIEIKVYDKAGKIISDFIMGQNDLKEGATYCVRNGYDQSYAMHVKVTEGGLRNYFDQSQLTLRDKTVMDIDSDALSSLKITYGKDKKNSFEITREKNGFKFKPLEQFVVPKSSFNNNKIDAYLKDYNKVYCEAIKTGEASMDSIRQFVPFAEIEFNFKNKEKESYTFYPMRDILDSETNTQSINDLHKIDRHFVYTHDGNVYIVQHRTVKSFFKPIDYFYN